MKTTVVGDFADPLSFLASQRVEQIRSLGLYDIDWIAVESDRSRPMNGRPLSTDEAEQTQRLRLPGEAVPDVALLVPNSRAATAAYAESLTDRVPDAMRRALFDALWVHGRNIADPDVIRSIVFKVLNPDPPAHDIDWRIRANQPLVPLGDADPIVGTRRLGFVVSMGRSPLTQTGQDRIDRWCWLWQERGAPTLPLLLTDLGEALTGVRALSWLGRQLPHRDVSTTGEPVAAAAPRDVPDRRRPARVS